MGPARDDAHLSEESLRRHAGLLEDWIRRRQDLPKVLDGTHALTSGDEPLAAAWLLEELAYGRASARLLEQGAKGAQGRRATERGRRAKWGEMIDTTDRNPPTPESLVARYRATGDPQAIGALFDATAPALFRIALSLVPDATVAEDLLQETYVVALEGLGRYDPSRPVTPWLVGILQNMAKRARRDLARRPRADRLAALGGAAGDKDPVAADEATLRVREAIDGLEEPYRSVALLRWQYGLSPAEIADVRGEPPGTTRSLLSRALTRLRTTLRGAAAVFLLPPAPRGLEGVREAVVEHAASLAAGTVAAAAGAAVGLSALAKAGLAAAAVAVLGGAAFLVGRGLWGSGPSRSGAPVEETAAQGRRPSEPPSAPSRAEEPKPPPTPAVPPSPPPESEPRAAPPAVEVPTPLAPPEREGQGPIPFPEAPPPPKIDVGPAMGGAAPPVAPPVPRPASPPAPADDEGASLALGPRIESSVEAGVRWLKAVQLPDGSWGRIQGNQGYDPKASADKAYEHPAGATALALYALLKSGVPADDPAVKKGFAFLRSRQRIPGGSYEISALLLAVTATGEAPKGSRNGGGAGDRLKLTGDMRSWAQQLLEALRDKRAKAKTLGWRYDVEGSGVPPGGNEDLSSTQLAALALFECERAGLKTDARTWNDLLTFALRQQEREGPEHPRAVDPRGPKGAGRPGGVTPGGGTAAAGPAVKDRARGFAYILSDDLPPDEGRPTGGMTACGLGVIQMARYALADREDAASKAREPAVQQAVYDGLAWLDRHWSAYENPGKKQTNVYHVYYLYCLERAFDLLGNLRLGNHLWYPEVAAQLLPRQTAKGFWDSGTAHKPSAVLDTCFALLFLTRATQDVIHLPAITGPSDAPGVEGR